MADALDIEETNRLRVSLGMPPLPVPGQKPSKNGLNFKPAASAGDDDDSEGEPGSTLESREAMASGNWQKLQAEADEKKKRALKKQQIQKAREAAQRYQKLQGSGLGEGPSDDVSTRDWLMGAKKREKKVEKLRRKKLQEELEERERQAAIQYGEKDLSGLKVGHELNEFDAGEQILTLRDQGIDEEDDDELENVDVRDREKLKERLDAKKQRIDYDPNQMDDEQLKKGVLSKYDEEIDGKKKTAFTLDGMGSTKERKAAAAQASLAPERQKINLDEIALDAPKSDYLDISEIKIKKPKKNKSKSKRRVNDQDDDLFSIGAVPTGNADAMEASNTEQNSAKQKRARETMYLDDDELQSQLAASRRSALKKRKMDVNDFAKRLKEEDENAMDTSDNGEYGMVMDETTEFIANLKKPEEREAEGFRPRRPSSSSKAVPSTETEPEVKQEATDDHDAEMAEAYNEVDSDQVKRETSSIAPEQDVTNSGFEVEGTFGLGTGAALKMLRERGLVKENNGSVANRMLRDKALFLNERDQQETGAERRAREQRERDRRSGAFQNMSKADREAYAQEANRRRDLQESRILAQAFDQSYRPNVDIRYLDDTGRELSTKEAFKHMSHAFHGKGSGKGKTEKQLKKVAEERKRMGKSMLDAGEATGMNNAQGQTAKKNRQAGVRMQ